MEHIVLFRWTEEASQEAIDSAVQLEDLRGLKGKIAVIVDLSCGANFLDRAKGYTHGLVGAFSRIGPRRKLMAYTRSISAFCRTLSIRFAPDSLALDYEF